MEESLIDTQKDTFRKLRDELFEEVDTERQKNELLEEEVHNKDKAFLEMKGELKELILNYETKEKECDLLRHHFRGGSDQRE